MFCCMRKIQDAHRIGPMQVKKVLQPEGPIADRTHLGGLHHLTVCSADVCARRGRFFLHVVVSLPEPVVPPSQNVIGVALGLTCPVVPSTRLFLGEKRWKEQERRIFRLRRKLQAKGSPSAKRYLK